MRNLMIATALLCVVALGCNKKENVMPAGTPNTITTPAPSYKNVPWTPIRVDTIYCPVSGKTFYHHVLDNFSYQLYLGGGGSYPITRTYVASCEDCGGRPYDCTDDIVIHPENWSPTE